MPSVINRHHYKGKTMPDPWMYIGRGTPLGNPFTVKEHGVGAIAMYRRWLWERIKAGHQGVLHTMGLIGPDHHLVCSCKPRPCHGDVVVAAWEWLRRSI